MTHLAGQKCSSQIGHGARLDEGDELAYALTHSELVVTGANETAHAKRHAAQYPSAPAAETPDVGRER